MVRIAQLSVVVAVMLLVGVEGLSWQLSRRSKYGKLGLPRPSGQTKVQDPPDLWFTQQLDHFSPTENRTWQQRYFALTDYFKEGGPVFLSIEGEGEASSSWMVHGNWVNYAKQYNALMFTIEHRFYGQSKPTSDLSTDNLRFLTTEQELADVAYFITEMNKQYQLPSNVKWIAFGGSYSGNLAAWVRFKYPHLIHGAMSASGPVLAQVDFQIHGCGKELSRYFCSWISLSCCCECSDKKFNTLMTIAPGRKQLKSLFKLCEDIDPNNHNDIYSLLMSMANHLANIVQYNKNNMQSDTNYTIDSMCDILTNKSIGSPLLRLAAVNNLFYTEGCVSFNYLNHIDMMRQTEWLTIAGMLGIRQWTYQTCTEFGYYQTSGKKNSFFGKDFPLKFFLQQCQDTFGFTAEEVNQGVDRTNILYGGLDLKATRVVYVHGTIDPWHALGVTSTRIAESPAILIEGTAHCANMYPPSDSDPPALTAARQQVGELIGQWLQEE